MNNSCPRHDDAIALIETDTFTLTAGGAMTPIPLGAAVLRLADAPKRTPLVTGLPGYRQTLVRVEWPDMGIPALTPRDWRWLAPRLRRLPAVHVHCHAGHGRTGTALAILTALWGDSPIDTCPVTWVREHYCPNAVETAAQIAYVARVTGRACLAKPSLGATPAPRKSDPYDIDGGNWSARDSGIVKADPSASTLRYDDGTPVRREFKSLPPIPRRTPEPPRSPRPGTVSYPPIGPGKLDRD